MKAMDLADYIILKADELKEPVSNLMLQKVMYFLNVMYLISNNDKEMPLVSDSNFERWDYGPVIKDVYNEYSSYGSSKIIVPSEHKKLVNGKGNNLEIKSFKLDVTKINQSIRSFIDENIGKLLKFKDPFILVKESHKENQWKVLNPNDKYNNEDSLAFYKIKNNQFWNR